MNQLLTWWAQCKKQQPAMIWQPTADPERMAYGGFLTEFGEVWRQHGLELLASLAVPAENLRQEVLKTCDVLGKWWGTVAPTLIERARPGLDAVVETGCLFRARPEREFPSADETDDNEDFENELTLFRKKGRKKLLRAGSGLCEAVEGWAKSWQDRLSSWKLAPLGIPAVCAIGAPQIGSIYCASSPSGLWQATQLPCVAPWDSIMPFEKAVGVRKSRSSKILFAENFVYGWVLDTQWDGIAVQMPQESVQIHVISNMNPWSAASALALALSWMTAAPAIEETQQALRASGSALQVHGKASASELAEFWVSQLRTAFDAWIKGKLLESELPARPIDNWNCFNGEMDGRAARLSYLMRNGDVDSADAERPARLIQFLLDFLEGKQPSRAIAGTQMKTVPRGNDAGKALALGRFEIYQEPSPTTCVTVTKARWWPDSPSEDEMLKARLCEVSDAWANFLTEAGDHGFVAKADSRTVKDLVRKFPVLGRLAKTKGTRIKNSFAYEAPTLKGRVTDLRTSKK